MVKTLGGFLPSTGLPVFGQEVQLRLSPFASFRVRAAISSLSDKTGRQMAGRTGWLSRE
jgi:hypothetical protein